MIEILGLALYGPLAASTRYRLGQFVPGLATHGIDLRIHSLLGDDYLRSRFGNRSLPWASMLRAGWDRLGALRTSKAALAILHCELFPLLPGPIERSLLRARPYVYDFDDAFQLKYRHGRLAPLRPLLGTKFDAIMGSAAVVTAGNRSLQAYATRFNPDVRALPTVVDTDRYVPAVRRRSGPFTLGWIGSPSTAPFLEDIAEPIRQLGSEGPVRLVVIGGKAPAVAGVEVRELAWSESTEIEAINGFDVGLMPLPDDEWARGKCAFKLIQYMACAIPVIGSAIGANIDVVTPDCGLLPRSRPEWLEAFRQLRDDPARAMEMGRAGRERVVAHYSLVHNLPLMRDAITTAVAHG